jgi:hypothetical protein
MNDNSHLPQTPTPIQFSDFVYLFPFIGKFMINACTVLCLFAANVLKLFRTNIVHIVPQASPSYIPLCDFNSHYTFLWGSLCAFYSLGGLPKHLGCVWLGCGF